MPDPSNENAVWVLSDLTPFGAYICTILRGDRILTTLSPDAALRWVRAMAVYATHAQYDAAVTAQLRAAGIDLPAIGHVVTDLRENREHPDLADTAPIIVEPLVASRTLTAELHLSDGVGEDWRWNVRDVHNHLRQVLEVSIGTELDARYYTELRVSVDLEEDLARSLVTGLADHRKGQR